jgi:molybdopterin-guanine dinucleotide biosynthesis protein A
MLRLPHLLLIGATRRAAGQAALAASLVRRQAAHGPLVAARILVASRPDADGGRPFLLTQTGRRPVWRLRAHPGSLADGLAELARHLDPALPAVAATDAACPGLEPGLSVIIRDDDAVDPAADAVLRRVGDGWDADLGRLRFADGAWSLREDAGAILLAGGVSRRMGRDKALLPWAGRPLIAHIADRLRRCCDELLISANDPARYGFLGAPVVADRQPGEGPLMGLASCLAAARHDRNLLLGCDMPHPPLPLLRRMLAGADGVDAVVPRTRDGRPEPLCAVYRRSCLPAATRLLAAGRRRMTDLLDAVRVRWVDTDTPPANLNTPADYQAALEGLP